VPNTLPIPAAIWKRFITFVHDERSGTILLHVRRGRVRGATISEQIPNGSSQAAAAAVESARRGCDEH
jgi:hypothetical protein